MALITGRYPVQLPIGLEQPVASTSLKVGLPPVVRKKSGDVERPPSPSDIHDAGRQAQMSSQRGNRMASCACGRLPEPRSGWVGDQTFLGMWEQGAFGI